MRIGYISSLLMALRSVLGVPRAPREASGRRRCADHPASYTIPTGPCRERGTYEQAPQVGLVRGHHGRSGV